MLPNSFEGINGIDCTAMAHPYCNRHGCDIMGRTMKPNQSLELLEELKHTQDEIDAMKIEDHSKPKLDIVYYCVFCERNSQEAETLITNHRASICNICIIQCYQMLTDKNKDDDNGQKEPDFS